MAGIGRTSTAAKVDPSMAYLVKLPSGRSIAVFFYDAPVAQAVAFERLLADGERLAGRLMGAFDNDRTGTNWCTSRRTGNPTAIISVTATWRWLTR